MSQVLCTFLSFLLVKGCVFSCFRPSDLGPNEKRSEIGSSTTGETSNSLCGHTEKIMKTASTRVKCKKNLESKNTSSLPEKI